MLFPKEFDNLCDDGFEGSTNEHQIFSEVFFESDESKKRCLVTGVNNFECDYSKQINTSCCFYNENSALMVRENSYGTIEESAGKTEEKKEFSNSRPAIVRGLNSVASSDGIVRVIPPQTTLAHSQIVTSHVVESTSQGVTSCFYLQKGHHEPDRGHGESHVTKLLAGNSPLVAKNSRVVRSAKSKWKDSCFVELDEAELSMIKDTPNDPRPILRYHINRLLRAAGWVIGRRKRSSKYNGIGEYVYRSPEGRPIREFRRAWLFCGESLFTDENSVIPEEESKVWAGMNQFKSDLFSTVAEIEEKLVNLETTSSLATLWYLLDPFANVVFIDKRIRCLKEGKTVIANRTFARYVEAVENQLNERSMKFLPCSPSLIEDSVLENDQCIKKEFCVDESSLDFKQSQGGEGNCGNGLPSPDKRSMPLLDTFNGPPPKYRKISGSDTGVSDLSSLPTCGSDSTSELAGSSLFDVPVSLGNNPTLTRTSETVGNNQDSSTSSLVYLEEEVKGFDLKIANQLSSVLQETVAFDSNCSNDDLVDIQYIETRTKGLSYAASSVSKKKAQKKSRKISEMKLSNLYQHDKVVSNTNGFCEANGKGIHHKIGSMKAKKFRPEDDDLLISAFLKNKTFKSSKKRPFGKSKPLRKRKSQKGRCKLLLRSLNRGGKHFIEGKWPAFALRTVLSWLIHSGVVSLNEVIQYRNLKDNSVVKDGFITRDGILCKCCDEVLSISTFKSHAGFKLNRPCLNLFLESDKPFTLCQLEAWSAEYKAKKTTPRTVQVDEMDQNDDSCGRCGDGGELICCDNCPSTFHQACLYAQELPEGSWYCPHCTCQICGDVVKDNEASSSASSDLSDEEKDHEACLKEKGREGGEASETWFCGERCQEVYSGLQSRIGLTSFLSDGLCWTLLRCIPGDLKVHSAQRFVALVAECNSKLAVALTIMEECFLPMVDPRTGVDMIPQVIYNWGSQFSRLNYYGFYTVVLEKDDVLVCVASIRIHGSSVAEMPLIATCSKYRRQGMCRRLMNSLEEMLKSFKVEKLVVSAIPSLVETWTVGFGFEPLEDSEKRSLSNVNLMVFPGTVWLKKSLYENGQQSSFPSKAVDPADSRPSCENDHTTEADQLFQQNSSPYNETRNSDSVNLQPRDELGADTNGQSSKFCENETVCDVEAPEPGKGSNEDSFLPTVDAEKGIRHHNYVNTLSVDDRSCGESSKLLSSKESTSSLTGSEAEAEVVCSAKAEEFFEVQPSPAPALQHTDPGMEIRRPHNENLQVSKEQGGEVPGGPDVVPFFVGKQHEIGGCSVQVVDMLDGRQFCVDEQSRRIHGMQVNQK
nr:increased DNA methylation 1 isoform X1 [Ipomoea batatas]